MFDADFFRVADGGQVKAGVPLDQEAGVFGEQGRLIIGERDTQEGDAFGLEGKHGVTRKRPSQEAGAGESSIQVVAGNLAGRQFILLLQAGCRPSSRGKRCARG